MPVRIDPAAFQLAHENFCDWMEEYSGGIPFTSFRHPALVEREIAYKWQIYRDATDILQVDRWKAFKKRPGTIVARLKEACHSKVSSNLLEHRYGDEKSSESPLYLATEPLVPQLEKRLCSLFDARSESEALGSAFDDLAEFVRDNSLGCKWPFFGYLVFLCNPAAYFPVAPSKMDMLLEHYGTGESIAKNVRWERYAMLLDVAATLKERLEVYGPSDAVDIQSYMWHVALLIDEGLKPPKPEPEIDPHAVLEDRVRRARERERIGLLGEMLILQSEREKLHASGRPDLAKRVRLESELGESGIGFDVLSFKTDGSELHIEVKTTQRSKAADAGFWLTASEMNAANSDPCWTLCRVWEIETSPHFEDVGNVATTEAGWKLSTSSWLCVPIR